MAEKKSNPWQQHVKAVKKQYKEAGINITYAQALVVAKESYDRGEVLAGTSKLPDPEIELAEIAKERQRKPKTEKLRPAPKEKKSNRGEERPMTPPKTKKVSRRSKKEDLPSDEERTDPNSRVGVGRKRPAKKYEQPLRAKA
jgi:hypothetical protein